MRFEIVTASGRGVHLAAPDQEQAICMRPVLTRTGEEGSARTPHLCEACGPRLGRSLEELGRGARERAVMRATLSASAYRVVGLTFLAGLLLHVAFDLAR